jgi:hypothetical protein
MFAKSMTANEEPRRAKFLNDNDAASVVISITDSENREPRRANPNNDTELPKRLNDLNDKVAPM